MPALRWTAADIEALATVDGRTREEALLLWRRYAPRNAPDLAAGDEPVDRDTLDRWIAAVVLAMIGLSTQLQRREMDVGTWQGEMARLIVPGHVAAGAAAAGSVARMTLADVGLIEQKLARGVAGKKGELVYLRELSEAIEGGLVVTDGRFVRGRTPLYGRAKRGTYHEVQAEVATRQGFDLERSVLNPADHCGPEDGFPNCVEEAQKGWVERGSLAPIGGRVCMANCQCELWFMNSVTGEIKRA